MFTVGSENPGGIPVNKTVRKCQNSTLFPFWDLIVALLRCVIPDCFSPFGTHRGTCAVSSLRNRIDTEHQHDRHPTQGRLNLS